MTNCSLKMGSWMVTRGSCSKWQWRLFGGVLAVFVVEVDELITMHAVKGQDDHHDEIRDEQRGVEPVPAVEVLEGVVAVVVAKIVAEIVLRLEEARGTLHGGRSASCEGWNAMFEQVRASR